MAVIEHSKTVLHRGREAAQILEEEVAELAEQLRPPVTPAERERMIAEAAYFRAEKRDFAPGHELEDWLDAEAEVRARFKWP